MKADALDDSRIARRRREVSRLAGVSDVSEREKMLGGQPYASSDPELVAARLRARQVVRAYNLSAPDADGERHDLLAGLLADLGDDVVVEPPFHCDYGWNISLGAGVYVNFDAVVLDCAPVTVGALTLIGPGVCLCAATHPVDPAARRAGLEYARPIALGTNVWLGANVVVGPGVTIGDDSVIGAGSVVMGDVPAGVVAAGNPCRVVRRL